MRVISGSLEKEREKLSALGQRYDEYIYVSNGLFMTQMRQWGLSVPLLHHRAHDLVSSSPMSRIFV